MIMKGRHHDLSQLLALLDHDQEALRRLVEVFLSATPETVSAVVDSYENDDMEGLARAAHKLKASVDLFKIPELSLNVRRIEELAPGGKENPEISRLVHRLKDVASEVLEDLSSA